MVCLVDLEVNGELRGILNSPFFIFHRAEMIKELNNKYSVKFIAQLDFQIVEKRY